jgi:hypothetical protein
MGPPTRMGTTCRFRDGFDGGLGTPGSTNAIGASAAAHNLPVDATVQPSPASAGFLNRTDVQDKYIRLGEVLISAWGTLSPNQRAVNGLVLVNTLLAGQLPPLQSLPVSTAHNYAAFDHDLWGIAVNASLVTNEDVPNPSPLRATETRENDPRFVLSALYHEARHAEQRFLAARYLAATRHHASSLKIAHDLQIPRSIARSAVPHAATLRSDRVLFAFAKWLYIGGFTPAAAATQAAHKATTDATRAAAERARRFIEANAAEWMGRGIAAGNNDARTSFEQHEAFERYKSAMRNRYHAFDAYAREVKEEDARLTSYRVAVLLGVTNNRLMELMGRRLAIDGMRDE